MKYLSLFIITLSLFVSACKKDGATTDYDKSYAAWQGFKKSVNNSYSYVTYGGSYWGYHVEAKTTMQNGKIVARQYVAGNYKQGTDSLIVTTSWAESGSTLNTHGDDAFYLTLDDVYRQAKSVWLNVDPHKNRIIFTVDGNGLISSAGSIEQNFADDCFIGIKIKDIKAFVKEIK